MRKLRSVNTHFWKDAYVAELESPEKTLFMYLLTNHATTLAGCYELSIREIAFDTKIDRDAIVKILERLQNDGRLVYKDGWIVLLNFLKHQNLNVNMGKSAAKDLNSAPVWVRECIRGVLERFGTVPVWFGMVRGIEGKGIEENSKELPRPDAAAASVTERPKNAVPSSLKSETDVWLDAVAPLIGAKSRGTMANAKRWREAVEKAVTEQRDLAVFMEIVSRQLECHRASPAYFTPEKCLAILQASTVDRKDADKWPNI